MTEFRYHKTGLFYAQISEEAKTLGVNELKELGAQEIQLDYRGVLFHADMVTLFKIVYRSRLFSRFLAPLHRFDALSEDMLYQRIKTMKWEEIIKPGQTFAIFANVGNSKINHSRFAAQKMKDSICDRLREKRGERPDIDTKNPDVWLNLFINKNKATVSLDLSGGSHHKRGYRQESVDAPLMESLAAAFIRVADWDGETPLYDPMCGSGTILAEALMSAARIPSGYLKKRFGFENMPDFDQSIWDEVKTLADSKIRTLKEGLISGSDMDAESVRASKKNLSCLPGGDKIKITQSRFQDLDELEPCTLITNPPYGMRLMQDEDMESFTGEIGDFLKQKCSGSNAWVFFGERKLILKVGLRPSRKFPLSNGGLDGRLCKFEMYCGNKWT
jgi:putative N6-adenine-specific DNA methylase